jgi:redox-sensitive bicupin YhaK (pirin superfamily)
MTREATATNAKKVLLINDSPHTHWVGDGFPARSLFPAPGLQQEVSPFLLLDYAGPAEFGPTDRPAGVGAHPHRGFETVTLAYQGSVAHRDSAGNSGTIHPGDVQWMTAASGVLHEEKHEREFAKRGGVLEMVQLWVNLPRAHKMSPPRYQTLRDQDIPRVGLDARGESYARVIAGELRGVKGPAHTFTPVYLFDIHLAAGAKIEISLPEGFNTAVFLRKGSVVINGEPFDGEAKLALLDTQGEIVAFEAREETDLLVLSGEPIQEPVASYGPFVMNTRQELIEAVQDYESGKLGTLE